MDDQVPRYMSRFTYNLESRLWMPMDGQPCLENCFCSPPCRAVIKTVWDPDNRGRRLLKCGKPRSEACKFGAWLDGPIFGRAKTVIDFLYETVVKVTEENTVHDYTFKCMEEEILNLQKGGKSDGKKASPSNAT